VLPPPALGCYLAATVRPQTLEILLTLQQKGLDINNRSINRASVITSFQTNHHRRQQQQRQPQRPQQLSHLQQTRLSSGQFQTDGRRFATLPHVPEKILPASQRPLADDRRRASPEKILPASQRPLADDRRRASPEKILPASQRPLADDRRRASTTTTASQPSLTKERTAGVANPTPTNSPTLLDKWLITKDPPPLAIVTPRTHPRRKICTSQRETADLASDFVSVVLTDEEIASLAALRDRWAARDAPTRGESSQAYQDLQERLLPLLVLPDSEVLEEFEARRDEGGWGEATSSQYWAALRKAAHVLDIRLSGLFRTQAKIFGFLAKEACERRPTVPATDIQVTAVCEALCADTATASLAVAVQLAYKLGQRIGDTLQVVPSAVGLIVDDFTKVEFVRITYRRGKTTRRRQPFTLHLEASSPLGIAVMDLAQRQTHAMANLLFVPSGGPGTQVVQGARSTGKQEDKRVKCLKLLALHMKAEGLTLLSLRRGGLQAMAQSGASIATLMHHSRHSTTELLDRYLGWGACNFIAARELHSLAQKESGQNM